MAKSKEDVKYGTAQAKLSEDEMLRVSYKSGTPIEGGKIADSEPVDLFSAAHRISEQRAASSDGGGGKSGGGGDGHGGTEESVGGGKGDRTIAESEQVDLDASGKRIAQMMNTF